MAYDRRYRHDDFADGPTLAIDHTHVQFTSEAAPRPGNGDQAGKREFVRETPHRDREPCRRSGPAFGRAGGGARKIKHGVSFAYHA